jgi:hypothetical protein
MPPVVSNPALVVVLARSVVDMEVSVVDSPLELVPLLATNVEDQTTTPETARLKP